jgi:hypothetical protein
MEQKASNTKPIQKKSHPAVNPGFKGGGTPHRPLSPQISPGCDENSVIRIPEI